MNYHCEHTQELFLKREQLTLVEDSFALKFKGSVL